MTCPPVYTSSITITHLTGVSVIDDSAALGQQEFRKLPLDNIKILLDTTGIINEEVFVFIEYIRQ